MIASRWHSPPNPALVLTSDTAAAPKPASWSASMLVAMSPSKMPTRRVSPIWANVRLSRVVLPAPGDDMRLTLTTPAWAKSCRLDAAIRSFSERIRSKISTLAVPVAS